MIIQPGLPHTYLLLLIMPANSAFNSLAISPCPPSASSQKSELGLEADRSRFRMAFNSNLFPACSIFDGRTICLLCSDWTACQFVNSARLLLVELDSVLPTRPFSITCCRYTGIPANSESCMSSIDALLSTHNPPCHPSSHPSSSAEQYTMTLQLQSPRCVHWPKSARREITPS